MTTNQFNQHRNELHPKSRTRRNLNMTKASRQDHPWHYEATGRRPPSNKITYDDDNPQHQQPTNMTRRRPFDTTHHAAYMTRIFTEPAKLTEVESADANIITMDPDVTDISASSSQVNRRVEQQLNFSSPYFDQLYKGIPEDTQSSGGGGDIKPKSKNQAEITTQEFTTTTRHLIRRDVLDRIHHL
jgi:hypothetical protein